MGDCTMTKLDELIHVIKNEHIYIQMHNYPDQDAIASAAGLQSLLLARGKQSTICYQGNIDKSNTLKMIELLHINIYNINKLITKEDDELILVDAQKGNVNVKELTGIEIACIDHHYKYDTTCYRFNDIRPGIGSCSSIIASYFLENNIELSENIATALAYGLKIDTGNFSRKFSDLDIDMFSYLYKNSNIDLLFQIESCSLKLKDLNAYLKAIKNLRLYDNFGVTNIGNDCSEAIIGTLADFLMTLSEVDFTVVYSYRAGGLKLSIRNSIPNLDANNIIRKVLYGIGNGGGHPSMAAGFIPDLYSEEEALSLIHI